MISEDDRRIDAAAKDAIETVISRNGAAKGRYVLITQAVVDDASGNGIASWQWYWNPDTSSPGDGKCP